MGALVLPLAPMDTPDTTHRLVAVRDDGSVTVEAGPSWVAAAEALAPLLGPGTQCDPALALVGRRHHWAPQPPTPEQDLARAAVALRVATQLPESAHAVLRRFAGAWVDFFRAQLWEHLPAELGFPVRRRHGRRSSLHTVALVGQGRERGFVFYEEPEAFDALWSGAHHPATGFSVLAGDDAFLSLVFAPFEVPPPAVVALEEGQTLAPRVAEFVLAAAAMQVVLDSVTGGAGVAMLKGRQRLELATSLSPRGGRGSG